MNKNYYVFMNMNIYDKIYIIIYMIKIIDTTIMKIYDIFLIFFKDNFLFI